MHEHPFIESVRYRIAAALILLAAILLQTWMLCFYGENQPAVALADSAASLLVFALLGYFSWYTAGILNGIGKQLGMILLVQLLCLSASHVAIMLVSPGSISRFPATIPPRVLFGVMAWIILFQWYSRFLGVKDREETAVAPLPPPETAENESLPAIDRISVKDGSRIHIIPLSDLVYIEASGDYMTLFTAGKQFIKEQTMKSLASQLPPGFVRIHRSIIVNSAFIARIELYEKQSYRLRLKNGQYLKVSAGGYKLLKEQLML